MSRKVASSAFDRSRNLLGKKHSFSSIFLEIQYSKRMKFYFSAEMRNCMDENHQNRAESKTTAAEDVKLVFKQSRKTKLWTPHKKPGWLRRQFKDKTLWDWMQLLLQLLTALALPIAIFIATQWFSAQQSAQQAEANSVQARNQQQETTYQAYLDRMSDLIENGKLADPHSSSAIRALAQSQTFAALRRSDAKRDGYIIQFLHDAGLLASRSQSFTCSVPTCAGPT